MKSPFIYYISLEDEYEKSSQAELCKFALLLATDILTTIDCDDVNNPMIKEGYAVNERWQMGNASMHDIRQAGF